MRHFTVVRQDHEGVLAPHVLRLKCKAIKKFVPYNGFYPAERTTELVKQFMDSYGDHVSFIRGTDTGLNAFEQYTRNFIKPLFAPGLLYNTIKSGLAVDYPIMTGSFLRKTTLDIEDDEGSSGEYERWATSASFAIFSNSTGLSQAQYATAVDCIDITGTEASSADVSFTILITTAAGGEHDTTAVTILLDDSATTNPAQGANKIAIGTAGISDAAKAAALIDAINGVSSSLVDLADTGVGQAGVQGVTAAQGSSDTQITLTIDYPNATANLSNAITTASGVDVVDVRSFTGGAANGYHHEGWDKRIPFEALIEPEKYIAEVDINDDEPSGLARVDATVQWSGGGDSIYRTMAHNFFAESANFFLKGGKTTGISSLPETSFGNVTPGEIYGMRVKLWRSMDRGKPSSGSWGPYQVPQNTREISTGTSFDGKQFDNKGLAMADGTNDTAKETFTMYSRPSAFGPALGLEASTTSSFSGSLHDFSPRNGIYGSHTPPYYDGESWIDLIFFPQGLESAQGAGAEVGTFDFRTDMDDLSPYQPTLGEIFSTPNNSVLGSSDAGVPIEGTFIRKWRYDEEELRRDSSSTYATTGSPTVSNKYGPAAGPWMNKWAMQGDASLNIFDTTEEDNEKKWRIQTKFETPMLNFNDVSVANETLTVTTNVSGNSAIPRGMWHQFGRLPLEGEGVYMQVTDIPSNWLATHPSATLQWDMAGVKHSSNKSPRVASETSVNANYSGYSVPIESAGVNPSISSLLDICGFNTDPVRIGEVSNSTSIREAIVAVPFIEEEGERKFFTIYDPSPVTWASVLAVSELDGFIPPAGPSIMNQIAAMERYVFPPTLDFVKNTDIDPFAMYIFEFEHKFDKNDLSHMWQNLSPKIGTAAEESTSVVSHDLMASELMGDWEALKDIMQSGGTLDLDGNDFFTPMNDKVQWMVFKVKQKAKTNYYDALAGKELEALAANIPSYTHNWPYDFCSIIELAKLDSEVQLGGTRKGLSEEEKLTVIEEIKINGPGAIASVADPTAAESPTSTLDFNDWVEGSVVGDD